MAKNLNNSGKPKRKLSSEAKLRLAKKQEAEAAKIRRNELFSSDGVVHFTGTYKQVYLQGLAFIDEVSLQYGFKGCNTTCIRLKGKQYLLICEYRIRQRRRRH